MTADRERKLRSTQRHMLRMIARVGRRRLQITEPIGSTVEVSMQSCSDDSSENETPNDSSASSTGHEFIEHLEPYADWIRRATRFTEDQLRKA
eukprot:4442562-Karenia_brevis.AAC.1